MNAISNKMQLIGTLAERPIITETESGMKKANLQVSCKTSFRNAAGEKVTETLTHIAVGWGKLAEIAEKYLDTGSEVAIEGKLVNTTYLDSKADARHVTEIHASELLILTKKS